METKNQELEQKAPEAIVIPLFGRRVKNPSFIEKLVKTSKKTFSISQALEEHSQKKDKMKNGRLEANLRVLQSYGISK
ncbi:MAG: hypothetical protein KA436_07805 [Oligoflexales bacterium]|nr:hypothetical protein [Oligoflexales bacterium]